MVKLEQTPKLLLPAQALTGEHGPRAVAHEPLQPDSILVTSMILPAHVTTLETDKVGAVVAEHGGVTSHGAIFARTLEIPAVMGVEDITRLARPGETAIVDGTSGRLYLSPDEALLGEYRRAKQRFAVTVEPDNGGSKLTHEMDSRLPVPFISRFLDPMLRKGWEQNLAWGKREIEKTKV